MNISIGREVNIFINRVNRQISNAVAIHGITGAQAHIINFIYNESNKRDIYQRDVEKEFDIRRSSTTNALQLLERKGLISRQSVMGDARLKKVVLTEAGIEIQKKVSTIIIQSEQILQEQLTYHELTTLITIIDKLSHSNLH